MEVDDRPGYLYDHIVAWANEHNIKEPNDLTNKHDTHELVDTLLSIAGVYPEEFEEMV